MNTKMEKPENLPNNTIMNHPIKIISILAFIIFSVITTEFGLIGGLQLIADNFKVSLPQAGMLLSVFAIVVAVFGPFVTLSFAQYNQKLVLCLAVGLLFIATIISTFANSFTLLLISRILPALVHALIFSVVLVMAASCFPPEKRAKSVSYVSLGFTMSAVIGIPLASYLSTNFSWRLGFALCALINLISLFLLITFLPNSTKKVKITFGNQLKILKKPLVWLNILFTSIMFAAIFILYGYFAPYFMTTTGMAPNTISIMLMVFGFFGILGNLFFGKITTNKSIAKVLLGVIFTFMLIYSFISLLNTNLIAMMIIIPLLGLLFASNGVVAQVWCTMNAQEAPEFANSLYVSFANLGITIGTFFGALFIKYIGISSLTLGAGLFLIIALVLYIITIKKMKKLKI